MQASVTTITVYVASRCRFVELFMMAETWLDLFNKIKESMNDKLIGIIDNPGIITTTTINIT